MKGSEIDPELISAELIENEAMNETKRYLDRGRRLVALPLDELAESWEIAFRAWFASRNARDMQTMDDAAAEFRLRGVEIPFERVEAQFAAGKEEIERVGLNVVGLRAKLEALRNERERPLN